MCNLKQDTCIYERLQAEGKARGDCWCVLKDQEEKRKKAEAEANQAEQYFEMQKKEQEQKKES